MSNKPPYEARNELYEKSKVESGNIKIALSNPALKDKLRSNINGETDTVFWYIRFNLELDPESVNKRTASVTERNGYIVGTVISYDVAKRVISILPTDCYAQNEYYLLNITKKVKSQKGTPLKSEVHILFKLVGTEITEYKIMPKGTKTPKPKKRPRGYVPKGDVIYPDASVTKAYTFDRTKFDKLPQDKLPYQPFMLNPLLAALGVVSAVIGIILLNTSLLLVSGVLCLVGLAHIIFQFSRPTLRSIITYNRGVLLFNSANYKKARSLFLKAYNVDQLNEYAEYAIAKVEFFT